MIDILSLIETLEQTVITVNVVVPTRTSVPPAQALTRSHGHLRSVCELEDVRYYRYECVLIL